MATLITARLTRWLEQVFTRNSLSRPNAQPLYQYQLSEEEYLELKQLMQQSHILMTHRKPDITICAAFCLFCAEWFRREYKGDWSWQGIWDSLGFELDASERSQLVTIGLTRYWQRRLSRYSNEKNSYLGSVFREGGLPFRLLCSEHSRFQEMFKRILRAHDTARLMGHSPQELVAIHLSTLPEAFKQDTTIDLVVLMIDSLSHLVDEHQLDQQENPSSFLDLKQPEWRRLFPIPMDEQTGHEFLNGLLSSASHQRIKQSDYSEPLVCRQYLQSAEHIEFVAELKLAPYLKVDLEREQLTSGYVELYVAEGEQIISSIGGGYIQFDEAGTRIQLQSRACHFKRKDPLQVLSVCIVQAGRTLVRFLLSDSALPVGEQPIGLRFQEEQWYVCGLASFSSKAKSLQVVLPSSAENNPNDAQILKQETHGDLRFIEFSGTLVTNIGSDRYRLSSASNISFSDLVSISGTELSYSTPSGQPIYLGLPEMNCSDIQAEIWVEEERYTGNFCASAYGVQTIKLKTTDGTTLYRKRLAVLPHDFELELSSGSSPNQGAVTLRSSQNFVASLKADELAVRHSRLEGIKRLDLDASGQPPARIVLNIHANLESVPVSISLPFPAQGGLAYSAEQAPLPRELVVEDLLGSRLQLYPRIDGRAQYLVELLPDRRLHGVGYEWRYSVDKQPVEISLYELRHQIRELQSLSANDLDAQVKIRVSGDCLTQTFIVRRYSCFSEIDETGLHISSPIQAGGQCASPVLMSLTDPKKAPKPLSARYTEGVGTDSFELFESVSDTSLIIPSKDSAFSFRARLISPEKSFDYAEEARSLYKAVELFHPEHNPDVIKQVLHLMTSDFDHSGWRYLIDLYEKFGYLPLSVFEVWKALSRNSGALCMLAFRAEQAPVLMDRLQKECNVLWELMPLSAWQAAQDEFRQYYFSQGLPEEIVNTLIRDRKKQLKLYTPVFTDNCESVLSGKPDYSLLPPKNQMNMVVRAAWYQDLMRVHSNNSWPSELGEVLESWYLSLNDKPVDLQINAGFQKAVVYFPVFAAALAVGQADLSDIKAGNPVSFFYLRQLVEFDSHWFTPVYQYCLNYFACKEQTV